MTKFYLLFCVLFISAGIAFSDRDDDDTDSPSSDCDSSDSDDNTNCGGGGGGGGTGGTGGGAGGGGGDMPPVNPCTRTGGYAGYVVTTTPCGTSDRLCQRGDGAGYCGTTEFCCQPPRNRRLVTLERRIMEKLEKQARGYN